MHIKKCLSFKATLADPHELHAAPPQAPPACLKAPVRCSPSSTLILNAYICPSNEDILTSWEPSKTIRWPGPKRLSQSALPNQTALFKINAKPHPLVCTFRTGRDYPDSRTGLGSASLYRLKTRSDPKNLSLLSSHVQLRLRAILSPLPDLSPPPSPIPMSLLVI